MGNRLISRCPFCGATPPRGATKSALFDGRMWHVPCPRCGARGPAAGSPEDAFMRWNERTRLDCERFDSGVPVEDILGLYAAPDTSHGK